MNYVIPDHISDDFANDQNESSSSTSSQEQKSNNDDDFITKTISGNVLLVPEAYPNFLHAKRRRSRSENSNFDYLIKSAIEMHASKPQ